MRIAVLAALASLVVLGLLLGRASGEPADVSTMKVAKVDLQAALEYETMALASAKARDSARAHTQLVNATGAINDMEGAVNLLSPGSSDAFRYQLAHKKPEPWYEFESHWNLLANEDGRARDEVGSELVQTLEKSNALKREMLDFVTQAIRDRCTELVRLRGAIEVNGVPQGHSQLTVDVDCTEGINELDLVIPNVVWSNVDAGKDKTTTVEGGAYLEVHADGAKSVSVTAETNPDSTAGQRIVGDIIPIAGDGAGPPLDETM